MSEYTEHSDRTGLIITAVICVIFAFVTSGCVASILKQQAAIKQAEADYAFSLSQAEAYRTIQLKQLSDAEDARRADELAAAQARLDLEAQSRREFLAYLVAQGTIDVNEAARRASQVSGLTVGTDFLVTAILGGIVVALLVVIVFVWWRTHD